MEKLFILNEGMDLRRKLSGIADMAGDSLLETLKDKLSHEEFEGLQNYIQLLRIDRDQLYGNMKNLLEVLLNDEQSNGEA